MIDSDRRIDKLTNGKTGRQRETDIWRQPEMRGQDIGRT